MLLKSLGGWWQGRVERLSEASPWSHQIHTQQVKQDHDADHPLHIKYQYSWSTPFVEFTSKLHASLIAIAPSQGHGAIPVVWAEPRDAHPWSDTSLHTALRLALAVVDQHKQTQEHVADLRARLTQSDREKAELQLLLSAAQEKASAEVAAVELARTLAIRRERLRRNHLRTAVSRALRDARQDADAARQDLAAARRELEAARQQIEWAMADVASTHQAGQAALDQAYEQVHKLEGELSHSRSMLEMTEEQVALLQSAMADQAQELQAELEESLHVQQLQSFGIKLWRQCADDWQKRMKEATTRFETPAQVPGGQKASAYVPAGQKATVGARFGSGSAAPKTLVRSSKSPKSTARPVVARLPGRTPTSRTVPSSSTKACCVKARLL